MFVAGIQAVLAGSVVGLMYVSISQQMIEFLRTDIDEQTRCDLQSRGLKDVDLDTFYMGANKCACSNSLIIFDPRRVMIFVRRSS